MEKSTNLSFKDGEFQFKGEPLRIFSGAMHYFRTVPEYWQDRLEKAKACGLNTIETYVPWNLHEPRPGHFKNDGILDLRKFIKVAADLDLHVIFRPGPYICSEWDFGGLPSWLLADPDMKVRSNYKGYQDAVRRYFSWLLPQVTDLQSSQGGPIFAVQVENEYGSFSFDSAHLLWLRDLLWELGISELLVTSDNETCARGIRALSEQQGEGKAESGVGLFNIPGVLPTANGMTVDEVKAVFTEIRRDRGGNETSRPLMVMELWSGWFDYWGAPIHETTTASSLLETVRYSFSRDSSINLYMFHGGTNFGFMNGALQLPPDSSSDTKEDTGSTGSTADVDSYPYRPDVTSYDYDAPLTEDGCITGKYLALREIISGERKKVSPSSSSLPDIPRGNRRAQSPLLVTGGVGQGTDSGGGLEKLAWNDLVSLVTKITEETGDPRWMESYVFNDGAVQSYGYIVYRKKLESNTGLKDVSFKGRVRDLGNILVNGKSRGRVDWSVKDGTLGLQEESQSQAAAAAVLDIVVENLGRVNYTTSDNQARLNTQRRGINGPVSIDGKLVQGWEVIALDFEDGFLERALKSANWVKAGSNDQDSTGKADPAPSPGPALYRGTVRLTDTEEPADYFVRLEGWKKGVVFVNGFNLGRYWHKGPTRTLYLPGPVLRKGDNDVVVFEEEAPGGQIVFGIEPQLG